MPTISREPGPTDRLLLRARDAAVERDAAADRVFARPVASRHGLADQDDPRRPFHVTRFEQPAAHQRDAHRLEIPGRDGASLRRFALAIGPGMILDLHAAAVVIAAERQDVDGTGGDDTRQGVDARLQPFVERNLLALGVGGHRQRHVHRHDRGRREAGGHLLQRPDAAHEQRGADEQDHRKRYLDGDERLTSAATDQAGGLTAPFLQRVVQGLLRQLQRRDQAEDQRGCGGHRGDKGEHTGVHAGVGGPGYGLGTEHAERRGRPPANAHAGDGAEHADHEALGEKLRDETSARRTKRGADGEFPLARGPGGEQQIRQVGARDQQHETDRHRQQNQALPGVADGGFVQRQQPHTLAVVAVRELLLEAGGDGIELGACGGDGRARRQPADGANEVPAAVR